jgi:Ca2+-binding EF-hand superfamily protein
MVHVFTPPKVDEIEVSIPSDELLRDPLNPHHLPPPHSMQQQPPSQPSNSSQRATGGGGGGGGEEEVNDSTPPQVRTGTVDMNKIQKILQKVAEAEISSVPEWERAQLKTEAHLNRNKKKVVGTDSTKMMLLERQLVTSIKRHHDKNATDVKHVTLSGRVLVPYYKISDITHFLEIFQIVDTNLRSSLLSSPPSLTLNFYVLSSPVSLLSPSGDLDIDEWCNFFTALNKNINRKQARIIFNRVDVGGKGTLSIRDLIPVVFGSCNKAVQNKIFQYVECELSKRKIYGKDLISVADLDRLFEYYDGDAVGFISTGLIREKIKSYQLPDSILYTVLDETLLDLSDEDMINSLEFSRMFRIYCVEYL